MTTEEYLQKRKSKNWRFSSVVESDSFLNVNRIHPIKQKYVKSIVQAAKNDDAVKRVIIFGSSIRYDCDVTSDLDICIDWTENCYDEQGVLKPFTRNLRSAISSATKGKADVVNFDYLDGTDIKNSVLEGVVVYEHNV